jgi:hypothetical protein
MHCSAVSAVHCCCTTAHAAGQAQAVQVQKQLANNTHRLASQTCPPSCNPSSTLVASCTSLPLLLPLSAPVQQCAGVLCPALQCGCLMSSATLPHYHQVAKAQAPTDNTSPHAAPSPTCPQHLPLSAPVKQYVLGCGVQPCNVVVWCHQPHCLVIIRWPQSRHLQTTR